MFEAIGAGAGTTRILNFLLAGGHLRDGARQFAMCVPHVDLECQSVEMPTAVGDPLQWGVRDQAAIPIMLAFDLYSRKPSRQCTPRHDVIGTDGLRRGIEIDEIAPSHIDRADTETQALGIDAVEIDQFFECLLEATGVVKARSRYGAGWMQPRRRKSRREESRRPTGQSGIGAHLVQPQSHGVALCREQALTPITNRFGRDALPERT